MSSPRLKQSSAWVKGNTFICLEAEADTNTHLRAHKRIASFVFRKAVPQSRFMSFKWRFESCTSTHQTIAVRAPENKNEIIHFDLSALNWKMIRIRPVSSTGRQVPSSSLDWHIWKVKDLRYGPMRVAVVLLSAGF